MPGAVTDVLRTLQSLPGVLAPNDFSSQLIVRGSGPDQNLVIMDDVEVFNPYRLYGLISMFNPEAVSSVNLITGGFNSRYGDRLSAVLDVTNREGNTSKSITGNLNASIVSANLVLEGKNLFSIPGSWLINSRRTYYDLIVEPFVKKSGLVEDNVSFPNFYDIQAKFVFGPIKGHKFLINGVYSRDAVRIISGAERKTPDSVSVQDESRNDLASLAWHYSPNKKFLNKVIFSWYRNGGDSNFDSKFLDPSLNRDDFENSPIDSLSQYLLGFSVKADYIFQKYSAHEKMFYIWNENNELEIGTGIDFMKTDMNFKFDLDPQLLAFFNSNPNIKTSFGDLGDLKNYWRSHFYAQNNFKVSQKLFIKPGIRFDYYDILRKYYFSPRLSVSYALDDLTTVRAVWGLYFQSPGYEKLRDRNILFDFSPQFTENLEAEKAAHYVLSFERWLNSEWRAKIEGYYKKFDNLIERQVNPGNVYYTEPIAGKDIRYANAWTRPVANLGDSLTNIPLNNSFGEAFGFEFLLEKKNIAGQNWVDGWLSYAYASAIRYEDGMTIPFRFDQRHTMNLVLNFKLNDWLDLGVRFQYGSGFPITPATGIAPRIVLEDNNGDGIPETPVVATRQSLTNPGTEEVVFDVNFGDRNNRYSSRKPAYHRMDIRISAAADYWDLDWTFYLDVINVYNRANIIGYDYYIDSDLQLQRKNNTMFPILPTLGFNVRF